MQLYCPFVLLPQNARSREMNFDRTKLLVYKAAHQAVRRYTVYIRSVDVTMMSVTW